LELYSAAMRGSSLKRKAGSIEKDTKEQWNQDSECFWFLYFSFFCKYECTNFDVKNHFTTTAGVIPRLVVLSQILCAQI
jgi:hypothetical protein